ncbi:anthrone oxygenase family protein [Pseudonocardia sp. TRM90224]|uniref:anthrone oxygenase family protein n=1 Tax=Pseudonocardia sp. TRM90224 TaxID=2812678 RepID=UPI001E4B92F9|nr:anthrone oxygenase family protein [Pseudonocardia sp. TRM90224]
MSTGSSTPMPVRGEPVARSVPVSLQIAFVTVGLMAGLFFAWDVSVMPGLALLDDRAFVSVMQVLVVAIENPVFFLVSFGALASTAITAIVAHRRGARPAARWMAAALAFYVAALVITMVINLPMNYALVGAGDPGGIADLAAMRAGFETPWRVANVARTLTCVAALFCTGRALSLVRTG